MSINHPQTYENPLDHFCGARIAHQLYCPPATGYAEHISAMLYATARLNTQTPIQLQTMTGGPPLSAPMIKTPERALHEVTIEKLKPIIPTRPKLRLSSNCCFLSSEATFQ